MTVGSSFFARVRDDLWGRPDENFAALDGIRGLASVLLVLYHSALFTGLLNPGAPAQARFGWLWLVKNFWSGVDMFFVLSGFLIGRILILDLTRTGTVHAGSFFIRRACRIFPAYYLVLTLSTFVGTRLDFPLFYFLYGSVDRDELVRSSWMNYVYLNNYLRPGNRGGVLSWGWSLCVEQHSYLLLPPLLWALFRYTQPFATRAALVLVTLAPFAGRAAQYVGNPHLKPIEGFYYYSHNRFDAILVGVLVAYFYVRHPDALGRVVRRCGHGVWLLGAALVTTVWVFGGLVQGGVFAVVFQFFLMAVGTGLLLVNGLFQDNAMSRFFAHPLWYPFARISYGTYLIHPFVLFLVLSAWGYGQRVRVIGEVQIVVIFSLVLALASALAAPLFVFLENPFLKLGARWAKKNRSAPAREGTAA